MWKHKALQWFVLSGGVLASVTFVCILVALLLDTLWGIDTLLLFYQIIARMFLVSMLLLTPICIGGIYLVRKSRRRES